MTYYEKYLKYKNKYLALKNQHGGECICPIDGIGFHQFQNACWHDDLMMMFCFADGIKEVIQTILNTYTDDSFVEAFVEDKFKDDNESNLLPINIEKENIDLFKSKCKLYLSSMAKRYYNFINAQKIPQLKRQESNMMSEHCVRNIFDINNINTNDINEYKGMGGSKTHSILTVNMMNYLFYKNTPKYIWQYVIRNNTTPISSISLSIRLSSNIIIEINQISGGFIVGGHVISLFKCNNKYYFYNNEGINDNKDITIIEFNWFDAITKWSRRVKKQAEICEDLNIIKSAPEFDTIFKKYNNESFIIDSITTYQSQVKTNDEDIYNNNYINELVRFNNNRTKELFEEYLKYLKSKGKPYYDILLKLFKDSCYQNNINLVKFFGSQIDFVRKIYDKIKSNIDLSQYDRQILILFKNISLNPEGKNDIIYYIRSTFMN